MNNPNNCGRWHALATVVGPVLQALAELRHATAPMITEHLGGRFTIQQVRRALSNLMQKDRICSSGHFHPKGMKGGSAWYWLPGDDPPQIEVSELEDDADLWKPNVRYQPGPKYSSVWDYAAKCAPVEYEIPTLASV